jgi:flagellin
MLQTAEGATVEVNNMLQRIRELAVQSANDTNSSNDRGALDKEVKELQAEITRISANTQWNSMGISGESISGVSTKFHVGANQDQVIAVSFKNLASMTGVASSLTATLDTATNSNSTIAAVDEAIKVLDAYRADLGAKVNRLNYAADNLTNVATNTSSARSRIQDTDYAKVTTDLARSQIIQQAATAMLAQANQQPASVLSLLQ